MEKDKKSERATEHKQMKRNNEIDLFSFPTSITMLLAQKEQKLLEKKHAASTKTKYDSFSTDAAHNHRKQSIIVNFLKHFFVSLQLKTHSSFVAIHFGCTLYIFRDFIDECISCNSREKSAGMPYLAMKCD